MADPTPYISNMQGAIQAYKAAGSPSDALPHLQQVLAANYAKVLPTGYFQSGEGQQLGHILRGSWGVQDPTQGGAASSQPAAPPSGTVFDQAAQALKSAPAPAAPPFHANPNQMTIGPAPHPTSLLGRALNAVEGWGGKLYGEIAGQPVNDGAGPNGVNHLESIIKGSVEGPLDIAANIATNSGRAFAGKTPLQRVETAVNPLTAAKAVGVPIVQGLSSMYEPLGLGAVEDASNALAHGNTAGAVQILKAAPAQTWNYIKNNKMESLLALLPLAHPLIHAAPDIADTLRAKADGLMSISDALGRKSAAGAKIAAHAETVGAMADGAAAEAAAHPAAAAAPEAAQAAEKSPESTTQAGGDALAEAANKVIAEPTSPAQLSVESPHLAGSVSAITPPALVKTPVSAPETPLIIPSGTDAPPPPEVVPAAGTPAPEAPAASAPAAPSIATDGKLVGNYPLADLHLDPARFQYKIVHGQGGVTGSLSDAPAFNQDLAGVIHAWRDPADGQTYVVNGHNRVALANRMGAPGIDTRFLNAPDAAAARTKGALINIAEGQGTPMDAAKLFRDGGITPDNLAAQGVSVTGRVATQGMALANLSPPLFDQVVRGEMPVERAVIIGGKLPDALDQHTLVDELQKSAKSGKTPTNDTVSEMADAMNAQRVKVGSTATLFGDEDETRNLSIPRAETAAYIKSQLAKEGAAFSGAAKNADRLERGNNVIDAETSAKIAQASREGADVFDRVKNVAGPTSDILNTAAERIAKGEKADVVKQDALRQFQESLSSGAVNAGLEPPRAAGAAASGLGEDRGADARPGDQSQGVGGGNAPRPDGGQDRGQSAEEAAVAAAPIQESAENPRETGDFVQKPADIITKPAEAPADPTAPLADSIPDPGLPKFKERPAYSSGKLNATFIPGIEEFLEQDVAPGIKAAANGINQTWGNIHSLLSPATVKTRVETFPGSGKYELKDYAAQTSRILADNLAVKARRQREAVHALKTLAYHFEKASLAERYAFIDAMESGEKLADPGSQAAAQKLGALLAERREAVQALGTGALDHYLENYFPHIWKDTPEAADLLEKLFGKKSLEGSKAFLKERVIPTTAEGVALGLEPISTNPVELVMAKVEEMDKYVMGQKVLAEMKESGIAKFVRAGERPPPGMTKIDDKIAAVWRPPDEPGGSPTLSGHYYAADAAANTINNHLGPSLRRFAAYRGLMLTKNTINLAQLGLSAFHLGFVSLDSTISAFARGAEQLSRGELGRASLQISKSLVPLYAPIESFIRGDKVLKEYYKPGSQGADIAEIVDALQKGGGRVRMDQIYRTGAANSFLKAVHAGNYPGAMLRAPFALIEKASAPLLEEVVPRIKLGVFMDMAKDALANLPPDADLDAQRTAMRSAWDSVDNRLGEMVYDNLFWNKTLKDLSMAGVRSVGWNLGTLREIGGGIADSATIVKRLKSGDPLMTHRMAYAVSLPIITGLYGALYQYLATGQPAQEAKDYFYPKTGSTNPDGTPARVFLPTYMKDLAPYLVAGKNSGLNGIALRAAREASNKANPLFTAISDMLQNKDYYGTEIRNPDDPAVKQAAQEMEYIGKQFMPLSASGALQKRQSGASMSQQAQSFVGIMPAPADVDRTRAEQTMLDDIVKALPQGARTNEQYILSQQEKQLRQEERSGKNISPLLSVLVKNGTMTRRQAMGVAREGAMTPDQALFRRLTLADALEVWDEADAKEKASWRPYALLKLRDAARSHSLTLPMIDDARRIQLLPPLAPAGTKEASR